MNQSEHQHETNSRPWLRGAIISGVGILIGIVSLVLFCRALDLNLQDQGWSSSTSPWDSNRGELITSCVGFTVSTIIFWFGFHQTTKSA